MLGGFLLGRHTQLCDNHRILIDWLINHIQYVILGNSGEERGVAGRSESKEWQFWQTAVESVSLCLWKLLLNFCSYCIKMFSLELGSISPICPGYAGQVHFLLLPVLYHCSPPPLLSMTRTDTGFACRPPFLASSSTFWKKAPTTYLSIWKMDNGFGQRLPALGSVCSTQTCEDSGLKPFPH